jgi:heat shock protein HslJ
LRSSDIAGIWVPAELHGVPLSGLRGRDDLVIDLEFDGVGTWTAYDGCNRATGDYTADRTGAFTATNVFRTGRACPSPVLGGQQVVAAVASASRVQVDGISLTLWGDGSDPTARLTRVSG